MKNGVKFYLTVLCLSLAIAGFAGNALANTAANTAIVNSAKLTFTGGSANATVTVTVALVPSQPNVTISYANGAYTAPDTPAVTDSVVISSTANGPSSYTVTPSVLASTNDSASSVSGGATAAIGATVTTGTNGTTFITVPASGASGNNATVNGIAVNATIVFTVNGNTYTKQVTSTTDNGDGTFKLNWSGAIPGADVPGAGIQVGEQKTVNLSVKPGTVQTPGTNITMRVQAVVSTTGAADVTVSNTAANPNTWTTPSPNISMTKYVRNLAAAGNTGGSGGTSVTVNGSTNTYYTSGVTGKPGDILEYVVVSTNNGAIDLAGCAVSDLVPTAYVVFQTGNYGGKDVFYSDTIGPTSTTFFAGAVGVNQASYVSANNPNLIVNVGSGANATTPGTIPAGKSVTVAYQVKIN
jgi:hypothetical protein